MGDLQYGLRVMRKNLGNTTVCVLSLALGIGGITAMYSFVDAVLLNPLPYPESKQLVNLMEESPEGRRIGFSPPSFLDWRLQNDVFSEMSAYTEVNSDLALKTGDPAERVRCELVSADYFDMLRTKPVIGRSFYPDEEAPGREHVAILTHRFWEQRFDSDPTVLGSTVSLNQEPYTIVGVLPSVNSFERGSADLWIPLAFRPEQMQPGLQFFGVWARLRSGVSLKQARERLKSTGEALDSAGRSHNRGWTVSIESLRDWIVGVEVKRTLLLLMGAVGLVLLISLSNVANLFLAKVTNRYREVAIRAALGAGKRRLFRQFLAESLLISLIGGSLGLIVAFWLMKAFVLTAPSFTLPNETDIALNYRVLIFAGVVSTFVGILFGVLPGLHVSKLDLATAMRDTVQHSIRIASNRSRNILLGSQVATAFILLFVATLLGRSFVRLLRVESGFQTENILTLNTSLGKTRYGSGQEIQAYLSRLLDRLRSLPDVTNAGVTTALPLRGTGLNCVATIPGDAQRPAKTVGVGVRVVSPQYQETMGMRLMKGRTLSEFDTAGTLPVAVISQSLANEFSAGNDPIGAGIGLSAESLTNMRFTVIGVTANVKHSGLASEPAEEIYISYPQLPLPAVASFCRAPTFVVRTQHQPIGLIAGIQTVAALVDKNQPVYGIRSMEKVLSDSVTRPRFRALLFGALSSLAVALTTIGIYGALAYFVSLRTREIGIRMALGGRRRDIIRLIIRHAMMITGAGLLVGFAGAIAVSRLFGSFLFGISPTDPLTLALVTLLILGVALLACLIPTWRATRVDPLVALRFE